MLDEGEKVRNDLNLLECRTCGSLWYDNAEPEEIACPFCEDLDIGLVSPKQTQSVEQDDD